MSKLPYSILFNAIRGKLHGLIYQKVGGIDYARTAPDSVSNPNTPRQQFIRQNLAQISRSWDDISPANQSLWNAYCVSKKIHGFGFHAFRKLNLNLLNANHADLTCIDHPPLTPSTPHHVLNFTAVADDTPQTRLAWSKPLDADTYVTAHYRLHYGFCNNYPDFGDCNTVGYRPTWRFVETVRSDLGEILHTYDWPKDARLYYRLNSIDKWGRKSPLTHSILVYSEGEEPMPELPIWERLKSDWVLESNPIIDLDGVGVYYPCFLHVPGGYSYSGTTYYFMAWTVNKGTYFKELWLSIDFSAWIGPIATSGLSTWSHPVVVYVSGDEKPYKMALWVTNTANANKWCESADGITWTSTSFTYAQPVGWVANGCFGFMDLNYNDSASNTGTNPLDYTYFGFMSHNFLESGSELPLILYSINGITWNVTSNLPAVQPPHGFFDFAQPIDREGSTGFAICQLSDGDWVGLSSWGTTGLWLLYSDRGVFFNLITFEPHQQFEDTMLGEKYEIERPAIIRVSDKLYLMWVVQPGASSSTREIWGATYEL